MQMLRNLVTLALLAMLASAASAADYYVDITNRTGYTVVYLHVSPAKSNSWEEDVLGSDVLPNGASRRVTLRGYNSSTFDIRLTDADGDTYTFPQVDVARQDVVATIDDIDSGGATQGSEYYVDVTNRTGYSVVYLQVSPSNSSSWEEDVLGSDVLPNGSARRITLRGYSSPIFDIRLTDSDGDTYTFPQVDVSRSDVVATLDDIDAGGSAANSDYYIDITNRTGYTIHYLQVSPANAKSWQEDVLGNDVMYNGQSQRVTLTGYDSPVFDVRLTDEDGDTYSFFGIDVSLQDLVVTVGDID